MKKLYFLLFIIALFNCNNFLLAQFPTGYPASNATSTVDEEIHEVQINTMVNNSGCSGASAALWPAANGLPASDPSKYANYTGGSSPLPLILLTPGSVNTFSLKLGYDPGNATAWGNNWAIYIDYNRSGTWDLPAEMAASSPSTASGPSGCNNRTVTGTFTVPSSISVGETLIRVINAEITTVPGPGLIYTWGETEDYKGFLGVKKWDYTINSMVAPDSISFCADQPQSPEVTFSNIENQPINGGRIDLFITDPNNPAGTNIYASQAFTSTIMPNTSSKVTFNPIVFPKDEFLKFTYIIYHPLDMVRGNDTLVKYVQVYKKPEFSLKMDTVCFKDFQNKAIIYNQTKPLFQKWANEAITDTTYFKVPAFDFVTNAPYKFGISVTRGWKCNLDTFVNLMVYEPAVASIKGDTKYVTGKNDSITLCKGQTGLLYNSVVKTGYTFKWNDDLTSTTFQIGVSDTITKIYELTVTTKNQCKRIDTFTVKVAQPLPMTKIKDTVCLGEMATIGLTNSNPILYLYNWSNNWGTEPLFNPTPIATGMTNYICKWTYDGCISEDTVGVFAHPLPNVITSTPAPICPFFSANIIASGADSYVWKNGFGTANNITVSPLTSTIYTVVGKNATTGCSKEASYKLFVYPRTDITVYSNKFQDNVCLGDSATIFVNGAKNYIWDNGSKDSIISFVPTSSVRWLVIGTDNNGCKDSAQYSLTVKPAFKPKFLDTVIGCEGDAKRLTLAGGKSYDWGSYGTDSFVDIKLAKTTSYLVTVTSPEDCQMIQAVPVTVMKAPVAQVSDLTICSGETGKLQAKGGTSYAWSTGSANTTDIESISLSSSQDITVTVTNIAGCSSTATTSVKVIDPDLVPVVFKSPLDSYVCPDARILVTMTATPQGGFWSGTGVTGNKFDTKNLSGSVQILYTFFEPINGCKVERKKNVNIIRKCTNSINGFDEENGWSVFPNPFANQLKLKIESIKSEVATINLYDLAGRQVVSKEFKLYMGENTLELNDLQLSKGTYIIELQTESISRQAKIIAE